MSLVDGDETGEEAKGKNLPFDDTEDVDDRGEL